MFSCWVACSCSQGIRAKEAVIKLCSANLKFLPQKTYIPLIFLGFFENDISVYWEQYTQELECPLLKWRGFCELREREPLWTGRGATTVTTARPERG